MVRSPGTLRTLWSAVKTASKVEPAVAAAYCG